MTFLTLTGIQKRFGLSVAVEDFNLVAQKGEFVSFLGPSGCGKTTTLRCIAGFEHPQAGRITLGGVLRPLALARSKGEGAVQGCYAKTLTERGREFLPAICYPFAG